jgi:hypothetical protein
VLDAALASRHTSTCQAPAPGRYPEYIAEHTNPLADDTFQQRVGALPGQDHAIGHTTEK